MSNVIILSLRLAETYAFDVSFFLFDVSDCYARFESGDMEAELQEARFRKILKKIIVVDNIFIHH